MLRKLGWVAIGVGAFFAASIGVSLVGMVVSALIPGASEDKPGKLEPDPQEKSKAEWLQQLEGGGPTETKETNTETQKETTPETTGEAAPASAPVFQQPDPTPTAAPPAPRVGPGNFELPSPYSAPPVIQSGPGNM